MKARGYNSIDSWISAFACAVICFMGMIPMRLSGLFFVIILDQFHISRKLAALPIVLYGTLRTLGGPFTGLLGEIFGLRAIICIGSILVAVGVGCCYFANDAIAIIIFFGLIYGIGLAFSNSLIHTVIKQNFTKNVNLANGVCLTGSCLGATIFSPVIQYLIKDYGVSGMFLILSGILLHAVPATILLRDPKNEEHDLKCEIGHRIEELQNEDFENVELSSKTNRTTIEQKYFYDNSTQNAKSLLYSKNKKEDHERVASDSDFHTYSVTDVIDTNRTRQYVEQSHLDAKGMNSNHHSLIKRRSKSFCSIFKLFLDPPFLLQMCFQSIHAFIVVLNWTIILDFGRDKGITTEWGLYFVMFLPVSEMFGNLSLNWITDVGFMSKTNFCIICLTVKAIASALILWSKSFGFMMMGVMIFGFLTGVLFSTFPGLIMEYIDKDKQNMALASRLTLYGVFGLLKSLFIAYFRETLGSYNGIYYFIIFASLFCAILCFFTPMLASYQRKRKYTVNKVPN